MKTTSRLSDKFIQRNNTFIRFWGSWAVRRTCPAGVTFSFWSVQVHDFYMYFYAQYITEIPIPLHTPLICDTIASHQHCLCLMTVIDRVLCTKRYTETVTHWSHHHICQRFWQYEYSRKSWQMNEKVSNSYNYLLYSYKQRVFELAVI